MTWTRPGRGAVRVDREAAHRVGEARRGLGRREGGRGEELELLEQLLECRERGAVELVGDARELGHERPRRRARAPQVARRFAVAHAASSSARPTKSRASAAPPTSRRSRRLARSRRSSSLASSSSRPPSSGFESSATADRAPRGAAPRPSRSAPRAGRAPAARVPGAFGPPPGSRANVSAAEARARRSDVGVEAVRDPARETRGPLGPGRVKVDRDARRERARDAVLARELPGERRVETGVRRGGSRRRRTGSAPRGRGERPRGSRSPRRSRGTSAARRRPRGPPPRGSVVEASRAGRSASRSRSARSTAESSRPPGRGTGRSPEPPAPPGGLEPAADDVRAIDPAGRGQGRVVPGEDAAQLFALAPVVEGLGREVGRRGCRRRGAPRTCAAGRGGIRAGRAAAAK